MGWIMLIIVYYIGFFISFFIGNNQQRKIDRSNYNRFIKECYISKNKIRDEKDKILDKGTLEIYETDSEDVIIAKYEDRALLDFCNSLLED